MKYWFVAVAFILAVCILTSCDHKKELMSRDRPDVVDKDFAALITKTDNPYIFGIEIKKVNPKANKKIGGLGCAVHLVLRDSSGRVFSPDVVEATDVLGSLRSTAVDSIKGKVRLIKGKLPPGNYTVQPGVRIIEAGKDAVRGHRYADMGTVAVPAENSVTITLPKSKQ